MLYLSSLLLQNDKYKAEAENFIRMLQEYKVPFSYLDKAKDIWVRDFMPIWRKESPHHVAFRYEPSYLQGFAQLRTDFKETYYIPSEHTLAFSKLNLDGGNLVFSPSHEKAIVSARVFSENPQYDKTKIKEILERDVNAKVYFIPDCKEDMTGHADGMAYFLDEDTVLVNESQTPNDFEASVQKSLQEQGFKTLEFPFYLPAENESAEGCYLNFFETEKVLFLPIFNHPKDAKAIEKAQEIFFKKIVPVPIHNIAKDGGGLHCITWDSTGDGSSFDMFSIAEYPLEIENLTCPVCGKTVLYCEDICENCHWQYDDAEETEYDYSPANKASIHDYREAFLEKQKR